MSIRASLFAVSGAKSKELAESKTWIPLCWLTLPCARDVERAGGTACVTADRKEAIDRCARSVPFLEKLFPEFRSVRVCADALLALLRRSRTATIGIELTDHFAKAPEAFPRALLASVKAIEANDEKCSFAVPDRQIVNPFTRKPTTVKAPPLKTTRDVLCFTAGLDPATDDESIERDQLIGHLLK